MYSVEEFIDLYKKDYFKYDLRGHYFKIERIKHSIDEAINSLEYLKSFKALNDTININEPMVIGYRFINFKCSTACGENYNLGLIDKETISIFKEDCENLNCRFYDKLPIYEQVFSFEKELIFTNAFRNEEGSYLLEDCKEEDKYKNNFSLNNFTGVENIIKYKHKEQNVLFGPMSNMSIQIYSNTDNSEIIVTCPYLEERSYDESIAEKTLKYLKDNNFRKVGNEISLSVWRYEMSDVKTLNSYNYIKKENDVSIDIGQEKNNYKYTHYFDAYSFGYNFNELDNEPELLIYSKIKKI